MILKQMKPWNYDTCEKIPLETSTEFDMALK